MRQLSRRLITALAVLLATLCLLRAPKAHDPSPHDLRTAAKVFTAEGSALLGMSLASFMTFYSHGLLGILAVPVAAGGALLAAGLTHVVGRGANDQGSFGAAAAGAFAGLVVGVSTSVVVCKGIEAACRGGGGVSTEAAWTLMTTVISSSSITAGTVLAHNISARRSHSHPLASGAEPMMLSYSSSF
jgi:hypothetical protein